MNASWIVFLLVGLGFGAYGLYLKRKRDSTEEQQTHAPSWLSFGPNGAFFVSNGGGGRAGRNSGAFWRRPSDASNFHQDKMEAGGCDAVRAREERATQFRSEREAREAGPKFLFKLNRNPKSTCARGTGFRVRKLRSLTSTQYASARTGTKQEGSKKNLSSRCYGDRARAWPQSYFTAGRKPLPLPGG